MDDLIRRQDAIERIDAVFPVAPMRSEYAQGIAIGAALAKTYVLQLPSAQKKGHWRNYEGTLTCSVCETEFDNGIMKYCGDDVPMFCPYCGADMRGEEE